MSSYPTSNGSHQMAAGHSSQQRAAKPRRAPGVDATAVIRSLRRRWVACVLVGLPLAVAAGLAAFFLLPSPYEAVAEIYFKSFDDNLVFETNEPRAKARVLKETHQKLVTSRRVLTAALRRLDVPRMAYFAGVDHQVEWLADHLQVRRAGEEFFAISLTGEQPQEIAEIVNAVADAYMSEVVNDEVAQRRKRLVDLQGVISRVEEDLRIKRTELKNLTAVTSTATSTQSNQKQEFVLQMQVEVRKQITQLEMELLRLRIQEKISEENASEEGTGDEGANDKEEKDEAPSEEPVIPADVLENLLTREPEYSAAKARVDQMKRFLKGVRSRVSKGHPSIVDAESQVASAEAELKDVAERLKPTILKHLEAEQQSADPPPKQELSDQILQLETARKELDNELARWKVTEQSTGLDSLEISAITNELGRLEALRDTLSTELEHREFELQNAVLPAEINERAVPPTSRSFKKKAMGVAGAVGGVLAVVVCGFVLIDLQGGHISSRHELAEDLQLPLIASLPALPTSAMAQTSGSRRRREKMQFWTSALKESVDAARTMLLSLAEREGLKTILVSSAMPGEGKTTLSLHLATSLARSGRRVILIDADLRRPSLSRIYGIEGSGVCEVARGEADLADVIVPGNVEGLSVVPAGHVDEDALEAIAMNGFGPALSELRDRWDFVIVDSSPVLPICDGLLFAAHIDGVIFAIRRDVSRRSMVAAALERFRAIGKPVIGAVAIGLHDDPAGYSQMQKYQSRYGYTRKLVEC